MKTALVLFLLRMLGESTAKVLDLGYTFDSKTIYVKKFKPFKLTQMYKGDRPDGFWCVYYYFAVNSVKDIRKSIRDR